MNRDIPRPYWKRAHRDWRMWVGVILMLACMVIYLITGDLRRPLPGNNRAIAKLSQPKIIVNDGAKFNRYCEGISGWRQSKL